MLTRIHDVKSFETLTCYAGKNNFHNMKTLSERLAYAMQKTGFNKQTQLAKAAGVEQSQISKILRGKSETSKAAGDLAAAMGVSADWLINGQGSIFGASDLPFQPVDVSKRITVWNAEGKTDQELSWFKEVPDRYQAYVMNGSTGIAQAPAGAIVVVDPELTPSTNDLVVNVNGASYSVFRYHVNGAGGSFLSVDDARIPLAEVSDPSSIRGTVVQIFIPELRR
ncbi:helix-turn-helix domain-containing protein [Citrobacter freundii]|uniref:helix-turn-helix domain-containing protein n=1 Tax=Citrobacter freundii TaxID=546 RepID=UPI0018845283|nr:helix-turn-helix domain-containing protein [Citrobacter freundii]MBE9976417.1 helix-turn-helix domain-containing protein [Citrobacter freundii]MBE9985760.1 helix-turn-helix domain-containing protein [Citrobacter freundii]MBF0065128.1 helix-turn-helix domain-containing protein [Citrobacter freundii]